MCNSHILDKFKHILPYWQGPKVCNKTRSSLMKEMIGSSDDRADRVLIKEFSNCYPSVQMPFIWTLVITGVFFSSQSG